MSSLFKDIYDDGSVKYSDVDRFCCLDINNPNAQGWHSGLVSRLMDDIFPIAMPYVPFDNPYYVYCEEGLSNPQNGDFDTIVIRQVKKPDGKIMEINRYFKEGSTAWIEIDAEEYCERLGL